MDDNPYRSPPSRDAPPPRYGGLSKWLITAAEFAALGLFLVASFLNNVTFATNDYRAILLVATVAFFVSGIVIMAVTWRWQPLLMKILFVLLISGSVIQLVGIIGRRLVG